jgi:sporulation integral membrane protein YtvI
VRENEKFRKAIRISGVALAVYGVFRYMLPLVAPFLFASVAAVLLKPSACWISERLQVRWRGKRYGIGAGAVGIVELGILFLLLGFGAYTGSRKLYRELCLLSERFPYWIEKLDVCLTGVCHEMEGSFGLKENSMVHLMQEMIVNFMDTIKAGVMPYLMGNSLLIAKCCIGCCIITVLFAIGVMLFIQELDMWRVRIQQSVFHQEFARIGRLLRIVGNAYVRTQGLIMVLTMGVCTVGFFLMGNPYSILAGIAIGILDALPIFGTGTVLLPWALITCMRGLWLRGLGIFGLYLICYFMREILEAKMMGDRVGLSPLETLISVYVGLQLFGVLGVLLGPVGVLVVKEFSGEQKTPRIP